MSTNSLDPIAVFGPRPWPLLATLIESGESPSLQEIVAAIREYGVPKEMGGYVVARLTERRSSRGRPREDERMWTLRMARALELAWDVAVEHQKLKGGRSPKARAIINVAKSHNLAPSYLESILRDGRKQARPGTWPTLRNIQRVMHESAVDQNQYDGLQFLEMPGTAQAKTVGRVASTKTDKKGG
jgi:hypothetical protein